MMDSVAGSNSNDISLCCRLDESSQSSASTVLSNDSNDEPDDHVVHQLDCTQCNCSVDDVSNDTNGMHIVKVNGVVQLSNGFMAHAKSKADVSTYDVSAPISDDSTKLICDIHEGTTSDLETAFRSEDLPSDKEVNNQELSLYHSDERMPNLETGSTESSSAPKLRQLSLLDQLDIIFEKLCFTDTAMLDDLAMTCACPSKSTKTNSLVTSSSSMDTILAILGCNNASTTKDFDYFSILESQLMSCCGGGDTDDDDAKPAMMTNQLLPQEEPLIQSTTMKVSRRGRIRKQHVIQQLLLERGRTSPGLASLQQLRRVRSFSSIQNDQNPSQKQEQQWQTPKNTSSYNIMDYFYEPKEPKSHALSLILKKVDNTDGYESDPCLPYSKPLIQRAISPRSVLVDTPQSSSWNSNKYWYDANLLRETVEMTMNSTWDLTWIHNNKPIQVQIWMEPGTILQNRSVMVEPCLMWRCLSSTLTTVTRRASVLSSSTPQSIRLLQICRVRPVATNTTGTTSGSNIPDMCRMSTSLAVRTIYNETFYFQAPTIQERDSIVHQWKVTIARLATLAVLEETTSLVDEFFLDQRHNHEHSCKGY